MGILISGSTNEITLNGVSVATDTEVSSAVASGVAPKVDLASFIGSNQGLTTNGYQKLPGGLIIQWGGAILNSLTGQWINFPIAFPNQILGFATSNQQVSGQGNISVVDSNLTAIYIHNQFNGAILAKYIAIGY